jgi:hypothetical protein
MIYKKTHSSLLFILLALTSVINSGCNQPPSNQFQSMEWVTTYDIKPGTEGMVELLDSIYHWEEKRKIELQQISWYKKLVSNFYTSKKRKIKEANTLLHEGETNEAIQILEELSGEIINESDELFTKYNESLAIAYLRWGEQENCIINHNDNSCILPIKEDGIYTLQQNTRKAIKTYLKLLNKHPEEWRYRWLLNVAYQTLGEYPSKVPKEWLIQSELMLDKDPSNNFKNIAPSLNVGDVSGAGGAVLEDFNNDGLLDIITSGLLSTNQIKYYENKGKDGFTDQTETAKLTGLTSGFNIYPLDYNNDGWKDLLVVRGSWGRLMGRYPNSLLKNNQDGTFSDVTVETGLLSFMPVATAVCADFNNDGWIDIYIGNESLVNTEVEKPNELYLNNSKGKFNEMSAQSGTDINCFTKGLCAGDYNNDGLVDLFISNHNGKNFLLENKGNTKEGIPQFENASNIAGVESPLPSFTPWFWDYDNDGWLDLFVSSFEYGEGSSAASAAKHFAGLKDSTSRAFLYHNNGDGTFTNEATKLGLDFPLSTMGANFGDVNNDGWIDFYIGTGEPDYMGIHPNRMLINKEGKGFVDKTFEMGVGHIQKGHGISFGDIDNDGDQDILAEMGGEYEGDEFQNALFQNPGNSNNWVTLKLEGETSSKDAIGARIKLVVNDGQNTREIYRIVSSGGSFGANSLQQEIGIAQNYTIDSLIINWPNSDSLQYFIDIEINKHYLIKELHGISDLKLEGFSFKLKKHKHVHH